MKIAESTKRALRRRLLEWFDENQRDLPWRHTRDPYKIWVSEIMLQQTRVEAVIPYYQRWLKNFPTLLSLAQARTNAVLKAWEGLGYYSRARNLHAAAQQIIYEHEGKIPRTAMEWQEMPGIGRYTAGAIASIAQGEQSPLVDGNVSRVFARLFALRQDLQSPRATRSLWEIAETLVPVDRPGDFNQALMELGATLCVPQTPRCGTCPVSRICRARQQHLQMQLPGRARRPTPTRMLRVAALVCRDGKALLVRRPRRGRLADFWELPSQERKTGGTKSHSAWVGLQQQLGQEWGLRLGKMCGRWKYQVTKFSITLQVYHAQAGERKENGRWFSSAALSRVLIPAADRAVLQKIFSLPLGL